MKSRTVFGFAALILPAIAIAQDSEKYQCTYGDMQRRVEILHEPGVEAPCSVHYYKDTEMPGEQQVLWSAENDGNYCRTKTLEFVAKLEGWGWDCGGEVDATSEESAVDETATVETDEMLGDSEDQEDREGDTDR